MRRQMSCDEAATRPIAETGQGEAYNDPLSAHPLTANSDLLQSLSLESRRPSNDGSRRASNDGSSNNPPLPVIDLADTPQSVGRATVRHSINIPNAVWKDDDRSTDSKRQDPWSKIYDDPATVAGYASVPIIQVERLPRGGISLDTKAVGRIQFGIPPETIKDSMRLGFEIPSVYIVPVERFCREMGPALGINLAEFEFPAYFNYFVKSSQCTLVVDSLDAETNIRRVFSETLLGPAKFRDHSAPLPNMDEDFDSSFPIEARPNFYKEFYHFRTAEALSNYQETTIDMLIKFCHFTGSNQLSGEPAVDNLGVPPLAPDFVAHASEEGSEEQPQRRRTTVISNVGGPPSVDEGRNLSRNGSSRRFVHGERPACGSVTRSKRSVFDESHAEESSRRTLDENEGRDKTVTGMVAPKRSSMDSVNSGMSGPSKSKDGMSWVSGASFMMEDDDQDTNRANWMYSQAKWLGDIATVFPRTATEEQKEAGTGPRAEIFKMTGGTEYIIHDVDENDVIVGKARFSGSVRVPDEIAVEGFLSSSGSENLVPQLERACIDEDEELDPPEHIAGEVSIPKAVAPPTFHPPSFGVTVLGNSHGFDKNGSTSGYVLWINGRGVMIDPPPYSSATLEREGIRPQMIMAILVTHCHADHDAGAFQKVMTGSRVAIITTPTIYKSFIRKYSALSGLNPTLLRHSHRHRPAIIGRPLKFQGAIFNFFYTLHTIPCIAFRVEWRGSSMVFTGDHLNSPPMIDQLEKKGVLAKGRADDLRRLPLQPCDLLLHESGAPPIHTPLTVLEELPEEVKNRLYVVHTSALPQGCKLRVAPTGTAGTIRLDSLTPDSIPKGINEALDLTRSIMRNGHGVDDKTEKKNVETTVEEGNENEEDEDDTEGKAGKVADSDVVAVSPVPQRRRTSLTLDEALGGKPTKKTADGAKTPPLVLLRPTCVSDAWFILNLLSAVPFLSSLSYANTMEVLETAQVEIFDANEVVIQAHRRKELLCVVWEGTCIEKDALADYGTTQELYNSYNNNSYGSSGRMENSWARIQPHEHELGSHDSAPRRDHPAVWHAGDWSGPISLQPDRDLCADTVDTPKDVVALSAEGVKVIMLSMKELHNILKGGSKLYRKYLSAKEKQAAEEAAMKEQMLRNEAMASEEHSAGNGYHYGLDSIPERQQNQWFVHDNLLEVLKFNSALGKLTAARKRHLESLAEGPRMFEPGSYLWQVGDPVDFAFLIVSGTASFSQRQPKLFRTNRRGSTGSMEKLENNSQIRIEHFEEDKQLYNVSPSSEYARLEIGLQLRVEELDMEIHDYAKDSVVLREERMRNARDRFANKVLGRLYARKAFTSGLVFSRGHFLSDTSRMVSGSLAHLRADCFEEGVSASRKAEHHCHSSNMIAGHDGCVVMVFPRNSMIAFLDANPGVLLSLLGTQVVV